MVKKKGDVFLRKEAKNVYCGKSASVVNDSIFVFSCLGNMKSEGVTPKKDLSSFEGS